MSRNYMTGRISKTIYLSAVIPVFVVAVLSFLFRIVIRIRFQRSLSVDDGFLAAGMVCLAFAFAALFAMLDDMFRVEALAHRSRALVVQDDDFPHMASFARWGLAYNVLLWTAACCVKFSFLALFRKLLDPTKWVRVYWWITTVFAGLTYLYGIAAFLLLCPYHYSLNPRECQGGPSLFRGIVAIAAQMDADLASDLLILVIPIRLIWKIQIKWTQKLALTLTLCLSLVMIGMTLLRASGIEFKGLGDIVWGNFWMFLAAAVGIVLASVSAFRTLFVAHARQGRAQQHGQDSSGPAASKRLLGRPAPSGSQSVERHYERLRGRPDQASSTPSSDGQRTPADATCQWPEMARSEPRTDNVGHRGALSPGSLRPGPCQNPDEEECIGFPYPVARLERMP